MTEGGREPDRHAPESVLGRADPWAGPLAPADLLLHSKALKPLNDSARVELERIVALRKLDGYSEADVREEIITPILRALGYAKESSFSVTREKPLRIGDRTLAADYSVTLFEEDFWVIEAKKPSVTNGRFRYEHLWQAVQYAIHPDVSAALVVLCDGHAIEIFDREESLTRPVLRVERANLLRDFDQVRAFLSPLQAWFFQKRRIVRLLDKVIDREFMPGRLEEFRKLLDRRLSAKEQQVWANLRALGTSSDDQHLQRLMDADPVELVEGVFPIMPSKAAAETAVLALVRRSEPWPFPILHRLFPDRPRAANGAFHAHALAYLIRLAETQPRLDWAPHWLSGRSGGEIATDEAVARLTALCLSHFAGDPARKSIIIHASASRRVLKAAMVLTPLFDEEGQLAHAVQRFTGDEFDTAQFISSPQGHLLRSLDRLEMVATRRFVDELGAQDGFKAETAKLRLKEMWRLEIEMLGKVPDYRALLSERGLDEVRSTETMDVLYDDLGHHCLCILDGHPRWRGYALAEHGDEVERLAALGSWKARQWLGCGVEQPFRRQASAGEVAERFFFGDVKIANGLARAYGFNRDAAIG